MPITRTSWVDDDGSGQTGTVINNAEKTTLYNQIDAYVGGNWGTIPFSAGNYSSNSGAWTVTAGNQITLAYSVMGQGTPDGRVIYVTYQISGTSTLALSATYLFITLAGLTGPSRVTNATFTYYQPGSTGTGVMELLAGSNQMRMVKDIAGTPWTAGTAALYVQGQFFYPG